MLASRLLKSGSMITATSRVRIVTKKENLNKPTDMKSKTLLTMLMAGVLSAVVTLQSQAAVILPGMTVVPNAGPVSGTLVTSMLNQVFTFSGSQTWSGSLDSYVYRNDPNNTGAPGGFNANNLTFVYQFHVTAGPHSVQGFSVGGWDALFLDLYQNSTNAVSGGPTGNHAADNASRSVNLSQPTIGDVVTWNFSGFNAVQPGQNSFYLIVRTNATSFTTGNASGQNGTAGNARAFVANVPEGGSLLSAFGVALIAVEALRRKLRRA
jgi:hypothetical protein